MQTKLTNKLGQRLALTPQLTQSLKVLAMNSMELDAYIEECLESNPLLELEGEREREFEDGFSEAGDSEAGDSEDRGEPSELGGEIESWQELGDDRWETMHAGNNRDDLPDPDQQWHEEPSLSAKLHEQIDQQPMSDEWHKVAHALIDSLEDDGYLRADVQELATNFQVAPELLIEVLEEVVQHLEPAGIGSRSLTECLLHQLGDSPLDLLVRNLLLNHSTALGESDLKLARLLGCSESEIAAARQRMRRLDPFPGQGLRGQSNLYVRPEVVFRRTPDGEFLIDIPAYSWRNIRLSDQWSGRRWSGSEREFMDSAMKEAKWLLYALDQRGETLFKVAQCLARRQRAFLEHGVLGLRPLTLQDVAEEVGLHESTISRVTNGKYAQTPLGLIEMRRFFSAGLPTRGGGTISVYRVQQRVRALIEAEPNGRPISDQAIADRLQAEGIEIARRTVAKYRESLGLHPSSRRRRETRQTRR